MGNIFVSGESLTDVTILSNIFIDRYMKDLNEAQLKVYLYLLRNCYASLPTGVNDLADCFNYTEKDVMRILRHLESCGLLTLAFDAAGYLCAITMVRPGELKQETLPDPVMRGASVTPVFSFVTSGSELMEAPKTEGHTMESKEKQTEQAPVSMEDLHAFKDTDACMQLLFLSESYFCKTLTGNDISILFTIYNRLGFDIELIDYLLQYCAEHNIRNFRDVLVIAQNWQKNGVHSQLQAVSFIKGSDDIIGAVMAAFGRRNTPSPAETSMVQTWTHEYGFSGEIILEACNRASLATEANRFRYADAILKSWHKDGLTTMEAILEKEATYRSSHSRKEGSSAGSSTQGATGSSAQGQKTGSKGQGRAKKASDTAFGQFMQTDYDFDAIEQAIMNL